MELLSTDITKFQALYRARFGVELDRETAYAKLSKLVRQIEIVYRPITKQQAKKFKKNEAGERHDD